MQKGKFLFLVFLLAAAVILGSTIGLISNVSYIVNKTDILEPEKPDSGSADKEEENRHNLPAPSLESPAQNDPGSENNSPPAAKTSIAAPNAKFVVISEAEKDQIISMLVSLGMTEKDNLSDFIRQFQTQHALDPTGILDSPTLDTIIEQTTLQHVSRNLQRSINY